MTEDEQEYPYADNFEGLWEAYKDGAATVEQVAERLRQNGCHEGWIEGFIKGMVNLKKERQDGQH